MSFILARKLGEGDPGPEPGNRQFVEFGGDPYKVCSMCHGTQEELLAALAAHRMDATLQAQRFDMVAEIDHHPVNPLVVREVVGLDTFRALGSSTEA